MLSCIVFYLRKPMYMNFGLGVYINICICVYVCICIVTLRVSFVYVMNKLSLISESSKVCQNATALPGRGFQKVPHKKPLLLNTCSPKLYVGLYINIYVRIPGHFWHAFKLAGNCYTIDQQGQIYNIRPKSTSPN